jgi:alpha-glucuronidase
MGSMDPTWLGYRPVQDAGTRARWTELCRRVALSGSSGVLKNALAEALHGFSRLLCVRSAEVSEQTAAPHVLIAGPLSRQAETMLAGVRAAPGEEVFVLQVDGGPAIPATPDRTPAERLIIAGNSDAACLHGVFGVLRLLQMGGEPPGTAMTERTPNRLRMIDHWDNLDGSVERGYAGRSIFFDRGDIVADLGRVRDYARMLASIAVNAVAINNVNVGASGAQLLTARLLPRVADLAAVFRGYGIRLFLSVDFASPMLIGSLPSADPLSEETRRWWAAKAAEVYRWIPDLGGFLVKADSERTPGPAAYDRSQADGANMLAAALVPWGGAVIWRAFVYDCEQDWRDRQTDRAKAAFDTFAPLDGAFAANVVLQVKHGPMDFQVREPPSPLLGGLTRTSRLVELQITQEYTGQQRDLCFLVSQWSDVLSTPSGRAGESRAGDRREGDRREMALAEVVSGRPDGLPQGGAAGVSNAGDDPAWTGHVLAQANLYGFGRLAWDPRLSPGEIAREWVTQTFGPSPQVVDTITEMLLASWQIYESYTAPLGIGWMVTPGSHYGPNVDGYEYSRWGTYHRADRDGIGIDRTRTPPGTGYTGQYPTARAELYENLATCPDELLLFFHRVGYTHRLRSGKTVIQHIYDSHFEGADRARWLLGRWRTLEGHIDPVRFAQVEARLEMQVANAAEWRDVVNSYFYRKSGIPDARGRPIY